MHFTLKFKLNLLLMESNLALKRHSMVKNCVRQFFYKTNWRAINRTKKYMLTKTAVFQLNFIIVLINFIID